MFHGTEIHGTQVVWRGGTPSRSRRCRRAAVKFGHGRGSSRRVNIGGKASFFLAGSSAASNAIRRSSLSPDSRTASPAPPGPRTHLSHCRASRLPGLR
ncbi:hypothetical protein BRADI_4g34195v3 [Brachypodium distachyon]|uniref:Uncharacterized protein n=1 Tax=Brachypodium distachyon TaxID=15368 RepID=A0A0Q3LE24_BRADI|nr:hypothetical protein BRADI_4g34195v3 [Brachypodium distachyon]